MCYDSHFREKNVVHKDAYVIYGNDGEDPNYSTSPQNTELPTWNYFLPLMHSKKNCAHACIVT